MSDSPDRSYFKQFGLSLSAVIPALLAGACDGFCLGILLVKGFSPCSPVLRGGIGKFKAKCILAKPDQAKALPADAALTTPIHFSAKPLDEPAPELHSELAH